MTQSVEQFDLPEDPDPVSEVPIPKAFREGMATAEDIWPYRGPNGETIEEPDFETYIHWLSRIEHLKQLLAGLNMPRSFVPRPYQVEGAVHLRDKVRGMVYDQPGLGKTLQAAMALTIPAVISCPGYLVDQWCDFLADQYPQWRVARIHSLLWRQQRQRLLDSVDDYDIWVVNHEMFSTRTEPFKGGPKPLQKDYEDFYAYYTAANEWATKKEEHKYSAKKITYHWPKVRTLILDESHHFRNREASQSENVAAYANGVDQVFLLTASPQYKDVRDWYWQLHLMDPRTFTSARSFLGRYTYATGWQDTIVKVRASMAKELQDLIARYALGRTYNQVGMYLPPIIEKIVKVPWHPDLKKAYDELKYMYKTTTNDGWDITIDPGAVLHTLRLMTANHEKVEAVKKIIEDIPGEEPVIVFCWYRDTAEILEAEFATSPSSVEITGNYTQRERLRRAADITRRVKCVTMASASEGVDWSAANTVIFFEEDYTPGRIYQALSRVRRHTKEEKKEPILIYYVHVRNSVDEAVHEAVTERQGDVRRILRRALK